MNNKSLISFVIAFAFSQSVYSQHSLVVVPVFQDESKYELYEIISAGNKSQRSLLDRQSSAEQPDTESCSHLRNRLKEAELLHQYSNADKSAWFYLEISGMHQKTLQPLTSALVPCLSFETEGVVIKSLQIQVINDSVGAASEAAVNPSLSSWLSSLLGALKFGGKVAVNVYLPGGSFFLHQSWGTALVFEAYKMGMISSNLAYIHVHSFKSAVDHVSETASGNFSTPFVYFMTTLARLNIPYHYFSLPFSKIIALVDDYYKRAELRRIEQEKYREQRREERKERQRKAAEKLKEFEKLSLAEQMGKLTEVVKDFETGKVKWVFFSSEKFKELYHWDAFSGNSGKEYQDKYSERALHYRRHIEWAQNKEKINPDYYKDKEIRERDRDWVVYNPMRFEKQGMLTFHQMTGCPEQKGKTMVSKDMERFSELMDKNGSRHYQQTKVEYVHAASYHFSLAEHETDKDKKEYHQKYVELFRKMHTHRQLENPAGLVSLTRTICNKYGK